MIPSAISPQLIIMYKIGGREGKGCKRKKSGESADDESMPIKTGRRQSESVDMSMNPSAGQINHSTFEDLLLSDRKRESN
jgi:hypothetical protein